MAIWRRSQHLLDEVGSQIRLRGGVGFGQTAEAGICTGCANLGSFWPLAEECIATGRLELVEGSSNSSFGSGVGVERIPLD